MDEKNINYEGIKMYIKTKEGKDYLMKSIRVNGKVKHQTIAYLGVSKKYGKDTKKKIIEIFEKSDGKCQNPTCQNKDQKLLTLAIKKGADYLGVHNDLFGHMEVHCTECASDEEN